MTERNPQVVREFKERQKKQLWVTVPVIFGFLVLIGLADRRVSIGGIPCSLLGVPAFAIIIGLLIFSWQNWRCPACNGYLGKVINPRFCSKCGAALQ